jgi:tetratricopeptide (TPR) repeat protein
MQHDFQKARTHWVNCPNCNRSMPPGSELCDECQSTELMDLAVQAAQAGRLDEAQEYFERICRSTEKEVKRARAYFYLGAIHLRKNESVHAQDAFERCLQLDPSHQKAKQKLVDLILLKPSTHWTEFERRMVHTSPQARRQPHNVRSQILKVSVRSWMGWVRRIVLVAAVIALAAIGLWVGRKALEYNRFDRHIAVITRLAEQGEVEQAMDRYEEAFGRGAGLHLAPEARQALAPVFKRLGQAKMQNRSYGQAEQLLQVAVRFDPGDREAIRQLERVRSQVNAD